MPRLDSMKCERPIGPRPVPTIRLPPFRPGGRRIKPSPLAFGCGSAETILEIPVKEFVVWLNDLNTIETEEHFYWYVQIFEAGGKYMLRRNGGKQSVEISKFFYLKKASMKLKPGLALQIE